MIRGQARGPVDDVEFRGARASRASPEALEALAEARVIVIGPSNPVISIGPILALRDLRDAISEAPAPVVAVSPIVDGEVVKGPTAAFMEWAGHPLDGTGVAAMYAGLIDGLVADGAVSDVALLQTDTLMSTARDRGRVAEETLNFALALGKSG
jgi:LPPG:FO 2-phospho-L-lactate transferase